MTTAAIIQARVTSTRFPGKVLAKIAGQTVLSRVIERAKLIPFVDIVVVAMPADDASIPIYEIARDMGVMCSSGSEDDVLSRYYDAAQMYGIDNVILRITADCPFIDPVVAGEVLSLLKAQGLDYTSNSFPVRTYPKGLDVEAFTFDCLEAAHLKANKPYDREHVTPWMQRTKGILRGNVRQKIDRSGLNWCVDYPEDIARLEAIVTRIPIDGLKPSPQEKIADMHQQMMKMIEEMDVTDVKPS